ncbi:hypothetical protein P152DRAFT_471539 [Eremomyces bilateralis CBS 781.70]|uniref:ABM domain-containing protein n=1 Tax=Eremomyces bilateralis CBS 781.70 TaxID=1392243 RepID=A0A6G1GAE0_9PEZI|nr:uncharacterized protein P152DRAFT_471539 [Eremomyces bilateralis CBS 781.70]KAF1814880.1 hypothetical protein P152DRAFT_471539 [Eremomyces bilateralis CBS 781.70]
MDDFYFFTTFNLFPDKYDEWQSAFDGLAAYTWEEEPDTKTYQFAVPLDYKDNWSGATSVLAFERYGEREDLYKTHFKSPAMAKFLLLTTPLVTTDPDLNHYECVGGFLDIFGKKSECEIILDVKIACRSDSARSDVLGRLTELADIVEDKEKMMSSGVMTWMAFKRLDNDTGVRIFGRYKTRDAMEKFIRREEYNDFWRASLKDIGSMESRGWVPNGKGWLHREGLEGEKSE